MADMDTSEAAAVLNTSRRRVAHLAQAGQLGTVRRIGRSLVVDAAAVHRLAQRERDAGRIWTARTAWAALSLLSAGDATWISSNERSRLRSRLRRATAADIERLAARRATLRRYQAHEGLLTDLAEEVVVTGASASTELLTGWGLTQASNTIDGYVAVDALSDLEDRYTLTLSESGNVSLRAVTVENGFQTGHTPNAAIALDLADSLAARERATGLRELDAMLARFRDS